jgi:osmotically inducible protein OsmC
MKHSKNIGSMVMSLDKTLYTAVATATGGREGAAGTNPEQLFAAGYSACFIGALKVVAAREKIQLPQDVSIEGHIGIGPMGQAFGIEATLNISIPGIERAVAEDLVAKAHQVCPYSNATRGNIDVTLNVV